MWLFTNKGFYTVVENQNDKNTVILRSRVRKDIEDFRKDFLPENTPKVTFHIDYDYPYRLIVPKKDFAIAMFDAVMDIDYKKFKESVREKQGSARSSFYTMIWSKMIDLEKDKKRIEHYFNKGLDALTELGSYGGTQYFGYYDTPAVSEWRTAPRKNRRRNRRR
jgi:hypothetical protein